MNIIILISYSFWHSDKDFPSLAWTNILNLKYTFGTSLSSLSSSIDPFLVPLSTSSASIFPHYSPHYKKTH